MALEIIQQPVISTKEVKEIKFNRKVVQILSKTEQKKETISIGKVWTNHETKVVKSVPCLVPYKILQIMQSLEQRLAVKNIEFGFLLKGKIIDKQLIVEDKFLPAEQDVTSATVHFVEDHETFNGVIHRHPNGVMNFSGTDETYINQNFEFSILYVNHQITKGILNVDVKDFGRMRLELDIQIEYPDVPEIKLFENKIFVKEYFKENRKQEIKDDLFSLVKSGFNFGLNKESGKIDIDESVEENLIDIDDEDDDLEDDDLEDENILNDLEDKRISQWD